MLPFLVGLLATVALAGGSGSTNANDKPTLLIIVGAPGDEGYGKNFEQWAGLWEKAGHQTDAKQIVVGVGKTNETSDLIRVQQVLHEEPKESPGELWLVFIGHGTFDGKEAKFNLRGPDLSAQELATWLQPFRRPAAIINCASSSGPFINKLSGAGRVVITATRSGYEQNYARFGQYLAEAITDSQADLDKDGQTSLLEAFLIASRRATEFYDAEGRLATEHALLDDNGDGLGTQADWFRKRCRRRFARNETSWNDRSPNCGKQKHKRPRRNTTGSWRRYCWSCPGYTSNRT